MSTLQTDPIFVAIESHRQAYAQHSEAVDAYAKVDPGHSSERRLQALIGEFQARHDVLLRALLPTRPTSTAGLTALATYLPDIVRQVEDGAADKPLTEAALEAVCAAIQALVEPEPRPASGLQT
ncbi:hypothetical protein M446_1181 [Methylobacterium sp. 4-46]|uniref:hypothetical protein n=1 Tax=unclassified Methylobacterium TaxID=2615210 RepID=UPI000152CDD9|nr:MULTISPECIES: hypothetical protein [Methylobacterium]ACA15706.1 hypothetical protein M446_1181 [Methylobacterium sp. 4-46]WFT81442.1 hypothetical protein QA634_06015 [Methylobacterium nodulans]